MVLIVCARVCAEWSLERVSACTVCVCVCMHIHVHKNISKPVAILRRVQCARNRLRCTPRLSFCKVPIEFVVPCGALLSPRLTALRICAAHTHIHVYCIRIKQMINHVSCCTHTTSSGNAHARTHTHTHTKMGTALLYVQAEKTYDAT